MKLQIGIGRLLAASAVAGLAMFLWGFVSNALLPWWNIKTFANAPAVTQAIQAGAPSGGVYSIPGPGASMSNVQPDFFVIASVSRSPMHSMGLSIPLDILTRMLSSLVIALLISFFAASAGFGQKLLFSMLSGLFAGILTQLPLWNWYAYPLSWIIVAILDLLVGMTVCGLVLAAMLKPKKTA